MAFTTEFVMGAGGSVEEIPVSMSGGGGTTYPLTTVDAGDGAIVLVSGTMNQATTNSVYCPHLHIGSYTHVTSWTQLTGPTGPGIGIMATGSVAISVQSRTNSATSFSGTVYVVRL